MNLAGLALLPAVLLMDRLFGELPNRIHPVCLMGALATRLEARLRRGPNTTRMFLAGGLACLLTALPSAAVAGGLVLAAQRYGGPRANWFAAVILIYACIAPRSLCEHARRVAIPLARKDPEGARKAVSMIVGRDTSELDAHGVARACVESMAENLTDGVLSTLFWAGAGLLLFGLPGAAALAMLHRSVNTLDALWGKRTKNTSGSARSRHGWTTRSTSSRHGCPFPPSRWAPGSFRASGTGTPCALAGSTARRTKARIRHGAKRPLPARWA